LLQALSKAPTGNMMAGANAHVGMRHMIPAYNDRVQDLTDALLNRFGPAHIDLVLAAVANEVRTCCLQHSFANSVWVP
jgi:hypothetical protein